MSKAKKRARLHELRNSGDFIRSILLDILRHRTSTSRSKLFGEAHKVGRACGVMDGAPRHARRAIDAALQELQREGSIHVAEENMRVSATGPRTVSMIYLRPTNDIPVNRVAARVIGPVWGSTGLL